MKTYTVFGRVMVEVSMEIDAENMEEALKKANESGKSFEGFALSGKYSSDKPIEWNFVEETTI